MVQGGRGWRKGAKMTAYDLREIGRDMSIARMNVPIQNRPKFEIESKDFFNAIGEAVRAGNDTRAAALLRRWESRVVWLTGEARCCAAPPCLVRRENESLQEYVDRCFDAANPRR